MKLSLVILLVHACAWVLRAEEITGANTGFEKGGLDIETHAVTIRLQTRGSMLWDYGVPRA